MVNVVPGPVGLVHPRQRLGLWWDKSPVLSVPGTGLHPFLKHLFLGGGQRFFGRGRRHQFVGVGVVDALGQAGERLLLRPYIQPQIGLAGFLVRPVTLETMPGQYRPNVALKIRRRLGSQLGGKQDEQPRMFQQCTTASHDVG